MAQAVMLPVPEMAKYYRQQEVLAPPEVKKLTQLDLEMSNILSRTDISSHQKIQLYHEALNRFQNVRESYNRQIGKQNNADEPKQNSPPPDSDKTEMDSAMVKEIQELLKQIVVQQRKRKKMPSHPVNASTLRRKTKKQKIAPGGNDQSSSDSLLNEDPPSFVVSDSTRMSAENIDNNITPPLTEFTPGTIGASNNSHGKKYDLSSIPGRNSPTAAAVWAKTPTSSVGRNNLVLSSPARKLEKSLDSKTSFKKDVSKELWGKTLNLITSPRKDALPADVSTLGKQIYHEIITNNIDIPMFLRRSPVFQQIEKEYAFQPSKRRVPMEASIDFEAWDKHSRRYKK